MTRHTVTVIELTAWMNAEVWNDAASNSGSGSNKRLEMSNRRVFRVIDHGIVKYLGNDIAAAVEAYNAAR